MEGAEEVGSGGHLVPLLDDNGSGGLDASLLRRLYVGHFLARWGARMWEFSVGLYMIHIWPGSLLFAAVYGVVESSSVAVLGPMVGTLVDRLTYLQMDSSNDDSDDDMDMYYLLAASIAEECEKAPYAPRTLPLMTGIQYVEQRMKNPKKFYKCFRMRRSVFTMLHDTLVANYGLESTSQMSSKESLALFLYMLGAPGSNSQAADRFERSVSTVSKKFHHVLDCVDRMAGDYITPNDPTFTQVHDKLKQPRFWPHFKDAIGAIDGTHIPVQVAEKDKIKYTNRKGFTSQNVLAICDFDLRFTFVVPGWPGSAHDTRVWTNAWPRFANYPHPPHGKYYHVDSGYPNRTGYLAPFKEQCYHVPEFQGAPPQNMQEKFNHLHSSLRNAIERAFGVLKMKWRILLSIPFFLNQICKRRSSLHACVCITSFVIVSYMVAISMRLSEAHISTRIVHLMSVEALRLLPIASWERLHQ